MSCEKDFESFWLLGGLMRNLINMIVTIFVTFFVTLLRYNHLSFNCFRCSIISIVSNKIMVFSNGEEVDMLLILGEYRENFVVAEQRASFKGPKL